MTRFLLASTALVIALTTNAVAQNEEPRYTEPAPYDAVEELYTAPPKPIEPARNEPSANDLQLPDQQLSPTMTPEIWFYLQELRRYDDPKQAIRRNAEFRAEQLQNRLAAMKWFGQSNQRPIATPTPFMGTYSPMWSSNSADQFQWISHGAATAARRSDLTIQR